MFRSTSFNHNGKVYSVGSNFIVTKETLGRGNFGEVRIGTDIRDGSQVAIKLEAKKARAKRLQSEFHIYNLLGSHEGIPKILFFGPCGLGFNTLVMQILGPSLGELFIRCGRRFSLKTVLMIAIQLIRRLECVHNKRVVHRDIKPENFLMSRNPRQRIIYIADFGLAKQYCNAVTLKHIPFREERSFTGTVKFISINAHDHMEQSRRDDMEALAYMLLLFVRGSLPWEGIKIDEVEALHDKIGNIKRNTSVDVLCANCPVEFSSFLQSVRQLAFDATPAYNSLIRSFEDLFKSKKYVNDGKFEWDTDSN